MSNLSRFFKQNKKVKENVKYAATQSLVDENGNPLEWEIKALSTAQDSTIREECTIDVQVTGKPGMYRPKLNTNLYMKKMACACVVIPDLYDAELQDSYGVRKPEELVEAMIDNPGEYQDLILFIQNNNGFKTMDDKVEEAKN